MELLSFASVIGPDTITYAPKNSQLLSQWKGETERKVTAVFEVASENLSPMIIFFDECDSLLSVRKAGDTDYASIVNEFLTQMNNPVTEQKTKLIFATNFFDRLDSAVLRRIDVKLFISEPNAAARCELFQKVGAISEYMSKKLAEVTEGSYQLGRDFTVPSSIRTAFLLRQRRKYLPRTERWFLCADGNEVSGPC